MDEYTEFQNEHNLPEYNELDIFFEISSVSFNEYPLKDIRRHIAEKLRANAEILEEIIHPNSTVSAYHECKFFSDEDKLELYDLYALLMKHIRHSHVLDVEHDDAKDATFIRNVHEGWPEMQKNLHKILSKLRDSWTTEISDKNISSYFG